MARGHWGRSPQGLCRQEGPDTLGPSREPTLRRRVEESRVDAYIRTLPPALRSPHPTEGPASGSPATSNAFPSIYTGTGSSGLWASYGHLPLPSLYLISNLTKPLMSKCQSNCILILQL